MRGTTLLWVVASAILLAVIATDLAYASPKPSGAAQAKEHSWAKVKTGRANSKKKPFEIPPGYQLPSAKLEGPRPPGTLLLNMLIKNERDHLDRTLPKWAKIIDCWIIGVDDANTDDSEAIIMKHLGHIPGKIVTVKFDGMGPTWTQLVKEGM